MWKQGNKNKGKYVGNKKASGALSQSKFEVKIKRVADVIPPLDGSERKQQLWLKLTEHHLKTGDRVIEKVIRQVDISEIKFVFMLERRITDVMFILRQL